MTEPKVESARALVFSSIHREVRNQVCAQALTVASVTDELGVFGSEAASVEVVTENLAADGLEVWHLGWFFSRHRDFTDRFVVDDDADLARDEVVYWALEPEAI